MIAACVIMIITSILINAADTSLMFQLFIAFISVTDLLLILLFAFSHMNIISEIFPI